MSGTWFKTRLNYLADRFTGKAGWTDKVLDYVPIAYYKGGYDPSVEPLLLQAQVGRSQTELLMGDGQLLQSLDRDFFIFVDELGFIPEENDVILDEQYEKWYCKVATRFTRSTFTYTNETAKRMRVRTVVIQAGAMFSDVPDRVATWLRTGIKAGGTEYRELGNS